MATSRRDCEAMDARDPLRAQRDKFTLPDGVIYLDGNSLGALPRALPARMHQALEQEWGHGLVRSWNAAGWYTMPRDAGDKIARLIGAEPGEVIVCDSVSVNLFKLLAAALRARPGRKVIVSERASFPTDAYITQSVARWLGAEARFAVPGRIGAAIREAGESLAAVQLTHVNYRTGRRYDMARITRQAHEQGALMLWDLAHSAGAMPLELGNWGVDLAVGCGYKYLNGGPGAPAFVYVARRHQAALEQPLTGWHGHAAPFDFAPEYVAAPGIERLLAGTVPQLSLIALDCALDAFDGVDMNQVRAKSEAMGELFIALLEQQLPGEGFALASPRAAAERGSQVSFAHPESYAIMQALIARGVIGDFRAPDVLRFGFAVLYLRFVDLYDAVTRLAEVMRKRAWDRAEFKSRKTVT
jgi:kynureninase